MSQPLTIVGAAILDDARRVLGAQRAEPPRTAGWWEFPGGKVEPGETDHAALVRECQEEIGVTVEVGERLGTDIPLSDGHAVLRVWYARITDGAEPQALEHMQLRWLAVDQLDEVAWLPADAPLIDELRDALSHRTPPAASV